MTELRPLGAEAYPYDPYLKMENQQGLDRLRCIPDRSLAANLFVLFEAAERNAASSAPRAHEAGRAERMRLEAIAERALDGKLGAEAKELGEHLLLVNANGVHLTDEKALREFALALHRLRSELHR